MFCDRTTSIVPAYLPEFPTPNYIDLQLIQRPICSSPVFCEPACLFRFIITAWWAELHPESLVLLVLHRLFSATKTYSNQNCVQHNKSLTYFFFPCLHCWSSHQSPVQLNKCVHKGVDTFVFTELFIFISFFIFYFVICWQRRRRIMQTAQN